MENVEFFQFLAHAINVLIGVGVVYFIIKILSVD